MTAAVSPREGARNIPTISASIAELPNDLRLMDNHRLLDLHLSLSLPPADPGLSLEANTTADIPMTGSSTAHDNPSGSGGDDNPQHEYFDKAHESCITAACQTLSSLYQLTKGGSSNPSPAQISQPQSQIPLRLSKEVRVPASDSAVSTARTATATVLRLLRCSCSSAHDPSPLSLLCTIVSRIVKWYQLLYDHIIGGLSPVYIHNALKPVPLPLKLFNPVDHLS